jgi:hypothetical protein
MSAIENQTETLGRISATLDLILEALRPVPLPAATYEVMQSTTPPLKCFACVERYFLTEQDIKNEILHDGKEPVLPDIELAVTFAPCWVQKDVGGMIAWTCITLPTCEGHLKKEEETPVQRARKSGLALPNSGTLN